MVAFMIQKHRKKILLNHIQVYSISSAALISFRSMLPKTIFSVLTEMLDALMSTESNIKLLPEIV